jgi:hypothetical protein
MSLVWSSTLERRKSKLSIEARLNLSLRLNRTNQAEKRKIRMPLSAEFYVEESFKVADNLICNVFGSHFLDVSNCAHNFAYEGGFRHLPVEG